MIKNILVFVFVVVIMGLIVVSFANCVAVIPRQEDDNTFQRLVARKTEYGYVPLTESTITLSTLEAALKLCPFETCLEHGDGMLIINVPGSEQRTWFVRLKNEEEIKLIERLIN